MAKIKHTDHTTCGKHVEELELSKTLGKNKNDTITLKNNLRSKKLKKLKNQRLFLDPSEKGVTGQTTVPQIEKTNRHTDTEHHDLAETHKQKPAEASVGTQ